MSKPDGQILVATESFSARFEGADRHFVANHTTVREGHPVLKGIAHLFTPIVPHYEVEQAPPALAEPAKLPKSRRGKAKAEAAVEQAPAAPAEPAEDDPPVEETETADEQTDDEKPVE